MTYPITGIPVAPGQPLPTRQEITAWYNNADNKYQVSLFMQSMKAFKEMHITELLSFFQIAGIHSYPGVPWDGVDNTSGQFCAHSVITFPMWHRPYMILYEQAIQRHMKPLIESWGLSPDDAAPWLEAASQFRLPYWDWARKQPATDDFGLPAICIPDTVEIVMPKNQTQTIPNPLVKFSNPSKVAMGDDSMGPNKINDDGKLPWSKCVGTSRYGIFSNAPESSWVDGVNGWQQANASIASPAWYKQGGGSSFSDAVSRMLSPGYFTSYQMFASTQFNDAGDTSNTNYMSLEYIHNIVHNVTGGQYMSLKDAQGKPLQGIGLGHMSDVPVAAFDPIFWFHHCNIDRLCAMWQSLNPTLWFPNDVEPKATDPLQPFHTKSGAFWTANDARYWTEYGYQYDDLVPQPDAINPDGTINQEKYQQDLRNYVDSLYPSTSTAVKQVPIFAVDDNKFDDYIINVVYDRYALNGRAYSILFFLGDPPQEISTYYQHENFLGQVYTFSAPVERDGAVACENCRRQRDNQVLNKAHIPITVPLMYKASLQSEWHAAGRSGAPPLGIPDVTVGSPTPEEMTAVIKAGLKVVFVELGGQVRPSDDFPKTEAAVMYGSGRQAARMEGLATFRGYSSIYKPLVPRDALGGGRWEDLDRNLNRVGRIRDDADAE